MVGHVEQFNPLVPKIKEVLKQKELGNLIFISTQRSSFREEGIKKKTSVVKDLLIHDLGVVDYLINEEPSEIYSKNISIYNKDDLTYAILKFKNLIADMRADRINPTKIRKITIVGENGALIGDYLTQELLLLKNKPDLNEITSFEDFIKNGTPITQKIWIEKKEPLKEEILYFLDCIKNKKNPIVDAEKGMKLLKLADKIIKASF